jgi:hypothetical protein
MTGFLPLAPDNTSMARRSPSLTRQDALDARPLATRIVQRRESSDGSVRITVPFNPVGYQRWLLRIPQTATREFELDAFGIKVLEQCDGTMTVRRLVRHFARDHGLNPHEAEKAVIEFLRTMMRKGLVSMVVPRRDARP